MDDIRFKSIDDFKFTEYYCLRNDNNSPSHKIADERTDIVKTFICALSFYYQIDFEELVRQNGLNALFTSLDALNITHTSIDMIKSMWYGNGNLVYPTSLTPNEKKQNPLKKSRRTFF